MEKQFFALFDPANQPANPPWQAAAISSCELAHRAHTIGAGTSKSRVELAEFTAIDKVSLDPIGIAPIDRQRRIYRRDRPIPCDCLRR